METSANNNSNPNEVALNDRVVAFLLTKEGKEIVQQVELLLRESKNGYETLVTVRRQLKKYKPKMKTSEVKVRALLEVAFTVVKKERELRVYRKEDGIKAIEEEIKIKEQVDEGTMTRISTMTRLNFSCFSVSCLEIVLEININTVATDDIGCYSIDVDLQYDLVL
jgi:hypothetical protein